MSQNHNQAQNIQLSPFADILPLLAHLPGVPAPLVTKDLQALLQQEHVAAHTVLPFLNHLQLWQKQMPTLNHPRLCLYASAYDAPENAIAQTEKNILDCNDATTPLQKLCQTLNADLRVYELDLTTRGVTGPRAAQAMTYGMLSVDDGVDVVLLHSLSCGADEAAQTLLDATVPTGNAEAILDQVAEIMGLDFFASLGTCLAARLAQKPVLTSGIFGRALIRTLDNLQPQAAEHIKLADAGDHSIIMPSIFTPLYQLQQMRFVLSFMA